MAVAKANDYPDRGIHHYVANYIKALPDLSGKMVLDIPCGDGRASFEFLKKGASLKAFDIFPEFMRLKAISAQYADLSENLPIKSNSIDYIICQEGIEHIPNQLRVFREFNRILKKNGYLLLTTPNYSHMRARLSYFFLESDYWTRMPPTEIDSVWFVENESHKIYFGHLFMLGVQKLQTLLTLSGFEVKKRVRTDLGNTSILFGLVIYPIVLLINIICWLIYRNKNQHVSQKHKDQIFWERFRLNLSPKTIFCKHIFWVLQKDFELNEVAIKLRFLNRDKSLSEPSCTVSRSSHMLWPQGQ
jgi:SAM-dependent methyltransferase